MKEEDRAALNENLEELLMYRLYLYRQKVQYSRITNIKERMSEPVMNKLEKIGIHMYIIDKQIGKLELLLEKDEKRC